MTELNVEYDRSSIFEKVDLESTMANKFGTPKALFNLLNSRVVKAYPEARLLGEAIVLTNRVTGKSTLVVHYEVEPKVGYGVSFKVPLVQREKKPGSYEVRYQEDEDLD